MYSLNPVLSKSIFQSYSEGLVLAVQFTRVRIFFHRRHPALQRAARELDCAKSVSTCQQLYFLYGVESTILATSGVFDIS